eukprot:CAMPEP_0174712790 /NCGR_PEP_ID=MMETSP1094-20130205/13675_1 /TAXON_ID=156173 /ORGANISM="Chrysochromulina brevifilum, Strain UTEX LB 985" /LENGTH=72 /DNA_ID=CAMNT_0015911891 /DNA_START=35 /DNA_END=250 /DNA_ORIENTATION=+
MILGPASLTQRGGSAAALASAARNELVRVPVELQVRLHLRWACRGHKRALAAESLGVLRWATIGMAGMRSHA